MRSFRDLERDDEVLKKTEQTQIGFREGTQRVGPLLSQGKLRPARRLPNTYLDISRPDWSRTVPIDCGVFCFERERFTHDGLLIGVLFRREFVSFFSGKINLEFHG